MASHSLKDEISRGVDELGEGPHLLRAQRPVTRKRLDQDLHHLAHGTQMTALLPSAT